MLLFYLQPEVMITSLNYRPVLIEAPNYHQNILEFCGLGLCGSNNSDILLPCGPKFDICAV